MSSASGTPRPPARWPVPGARRRNALSEVRRRLLGRAATVPLLLPFDELLAALGRTGQTPLGEQVIELDTVVGSVQHDGFDRLHRATGPTAERIAAALRAAEPVPAIEVYRIGEGHFVVDGHRRVAVARALGRRTIAATVTELHTAVGAGRDLRLDDLPLLGHERLFAERVPLPPPLRNRLELRRVAEYAALAEHVEAWGFRYALLHGLPLDRRTAAAAWFAQEYLPTVALLRQAGLLDRDTEAEAYLRLAGDRDRLLRAPADLIDPPGPMP
jgi:hypothetical protein